MTSVPDHVNSANGIDFTTAGEQTCDGISLIHRIFRAIKYAQYTGIVGGHCMFEVLVELVRIPGEVWRAGLKWSNMTKSNCAAVTIVLWLHGCYFMMLSRMIDPRAACAG